MSIQVSYKKQFLVFLIIFALILSSAELIIRIYDVPNPPAKITAFIFLIISNSCLIFTIPKSYLNLLKTS